MRDAVGAAPYPEVMSQQPRRAVLGDVHELALVADEGTPFFSTPHFDGHPSVLLRASRVGELDRDELAEVVQDAWLAQASARRRDAWLAEHPP